MGALGSFFGWAVTFTGVLLAWILFRAQSFGEATVYLRGLVGQSGLAVAPGALILFCLAAVVMDHLAGWMDERRPGVVEQLHPIVRGAYFVFLVIFAWHTMPREANPFIYFQF